MYCDAEILMDINGGGKWAAFNVNGGYHSCKKQEPIVTVNQKERTRQTRGPGLD